MNRIKNGKVEINRCLYKDIKKFDRTTMENFLQDIYQQGLKDGAADSKSNINISEFLSKCYTKILMEKGFGIKKADIIERILIEVLKELKLYGEEK